MKNKKVLLAVLAIVVVAAVVFGSGLLYQGRLLLFSVKPVSPGLPGTGNDSEEATTEYYYEEVEEDSSDYYEIGYKGFFSSGLDSDKDGLSNALEEALGTDASDADTDDGGTCDGYEVTQYRTDPLNSEDDYSEWAAIDSETGEVTLSDDGTGCP